MSIRIGRILDIPIKVDVSWLVIFALIVYTLAVGHFRQMYPQFTPAMDWIGGVTAGLLLFASVLLHELMHSYVARRNNLPVGGITLFIFGGVSELNEEPRTPAVELKMALAGPITSLVLGGVLLAGVALIGDSVSQLGRAILTYLGVINISLGVFNMIPGFPLDGGRVLRSILWGTMKDLDRATRIASGVGQAVGYAFILGGFLLMFSNQFLSGLWLVFIGWFLNNAAQQSYQQLVLRRALSGVSVSRIMTTDFPHVTPDTTVEDFVHNYLLRYDYGAFPVSSGEDFAGIATVAEVREVPREEWSSRRVGDIAKPPEEETVIDESDDAFEALMHMARGHVRRLLVLHGGKLRGMVTHENVLNIVRTKLQLGM